MQGLALQNFMQKAAILSHDIDKGSILYKEDTRHPKCENRRFDTVQNKANRSWEYSNAFPSIYFRPLKLILHHLFLYFYNPNVLIYNFVLLSK